jgi:hypothetical protein
MSDKTEKAVLAKLDPNSLLCECLIHGADYSSGDRRELPPPNFQVAHFSVTVLVVVVCYNAAIL